MLKRQDEWENSARETRGDEGQGGSRQPYVSLFGRRIPIPRSRLARLATGVVFIILGLFGFLPVLGFWMIPFGLLILSYDIASVRRQRRKLTVRWSRRNGKR